MIKNDNQQAETTRWVRGQACNLKSRIANHKRAHQNTQIYTRHKALCRRQQTTHSHNFIQPPNTQERKRAQPHARTHARMGTPHHTTSRHVTQTQNPQPAALSTPQKDASARHETSCTQAGGSTLRSLVNDRRSHRHVLSVCLSVLSVLQEPRKESVRLTKTF